MDGMGWERFMQLHLRENLPAMYVHTEVHVPTCDGFDFPFGRPGEP
jgi:hypothetical protein